MKIKKVSRFYNKAAGDSFCFDDCISTYANDCGAEFRIACLEALRNSFIINNGQLTSNAHHLYKNIDELCGIQGKNMFVETNEERMEMAISELKKGNRVLIGIKGNCCPWDWRYQEMELEGGHSFFLVDVDEESRTFICVDPYYDIPKAELSFECFMKGVTQSISYSCINARDWNKSEIIDKFDAETHYWEEAFANYNKLCENLEICVDKSLENMSQNGIGSPYDNINSNSLYQFMEDVANNRIRFAWFLEYLREQNIIISDKYVESIVDISKMWNTVKKVFVKNIIRGRVDTDKLKEKLTEVCKLERDLLKELADAVHNRVAYDKSLDRLCTTQRDGKYIQINLNSYYNNVGFSRKEGNIADFSGFGEWIDVNSVPINTEIMCGDIQFIISEPLNEADNIVCKKQGIEISQRCTEIHFVACTDWEECNEVFKVKYEDGTSEQIFVDIFEWIPDRSNPHDNVLIVASKNIKGRKDRFEKCNLYNFKILSDGNKVVKEVILPNNENIHIFAMTVLGTI